MVGRLYIIHITYRATGSGSRLLGTPGPLGNINILLQNLRDLRHLDSTFTHVAVQTQIGYLQTTV